MTEVALRRLETPQREDPERPGNRPGSSYATREGSIVQGNDKATSDYGADSVAQIREAVREELATKLAWAVGSTLHVGYGRKTHLRRWALGMAERLYERRLEGLDWAGKRGNRRRDPN